LHSPDRAGDGNRNRMTSLEGFGRRKAELLFCRSSGAYPCP
jgi:hypothetical protein